MADQSSSSSSFPTWSFHKPCLKMDWTPITDIPLTLTTVTDAKDFDDADVVVVGVFAPQPPVETPPKDAIVEPVELTAIAQTINEQQVSGAFTSLLAEAVKSFKNGATIGSVTPTLRTVGGDKSKRYILFGLGPIKTKDGNDPDWTTAGSAIGKALATIVTTEKGNVTSIKFLLPAVLGTNTALIQTLSVAFYDNLYTDNRYRTGANIVKIGDENGTSLQILVEGASADNTVLPTEAIETGKKIVAGVYLAKDIVNAPHNVLNAVSLAETARRLATEYPDVLTCTILDVEECEKRGMGAYLGVARGSEVEPQFIHLTYKPPNTTVDTPLTKLGFVGKGVVFDTGGYNIKTAMMELMKFDCGGAAGVIGSARSIALLQPTGVECHFIVAACDNMISSKAYVPSDVLIASNGTTIEVLNTDAEGRLTLADALIYADKEIQCQEIIELSTLTGACMVALGKSISGLWTSHDEFATEILRCGTVTGDKTWRMPLIAEYREEYSKSLIADVKNLGGRWGGAITAALFVHDFVDSTKPFAHIDIAGVAWNDKTGATGYGVKLLSEYVTKKSSGSTTAST